MGLYNESEATHKLVRFSVVQSAEDKASHLCGKVNSGLYCKPYLGVAMSSRKKNKSVNKTQAARSLRSKVLCS